MQLCDKYCSLNLEMVSGSLINVAQTTLYMAAKFDDHMERRLDWADFERKTCGVPSFMELMEFYGESADEFTWEGDMRLVEFHIMNALNFKLKILTPCEVVESLCTLISEACQSEYDLEVPRVR